MQLNKLPKITRRGAKRVGRGIGSGKGGHTSGRGMKGQKSRDKISPIFEGTKIKKSFIKRLPLWRGRGKLKSWENKPLIINLQALSEWPKGIPVSEDNLVKKGWLKESGSKLVKILGTGEIKQVLDVRVRTSKSAREKILKAGGKVVD
jgi:large subunit ribosomal protein L15